MKIINASSLITYYKPGDLIIRTKPVLNFEDKDESYTNDEEECGPILITEIKNNGSICYKDKGGKGNKGNFFKSELLIGQWLDGWKKYIPNENSK